MRLTEQTDRFDRAYRDGTPPWVIDEPQPAVVELERIGGFRGRVLDVGCGAGEHALLLAGLGYDVVGADASPTALSIARDRAAARRLDVPFVQVDALEPTDLGSFDTILDSALFHVFTPEQQARYTLALRGLCEPGAVLHLLALAHTVDGPNIGPAICQSTIRAAFDRPGWSMQAILSSEYRGVVSEGQSDPLGVPAGTRLDVPAWLARVHRVARG